MERSQHPGPVTAPRSGSWRRPASFAWVPWSWVRKLHPPGAWAALATLFDAYHSVHRTLDLDRVREGLPHRRPSDPCRRCGGCCAELIPEPVGADRILFWAETGNPIHLFHAPIAAGPMAGRFYTGWHHNGARLRMCPLLLRDPGSGDLFCAVYHLGPGHRPPGCEGFRPNWPHCEVSQRPLVP